MRIQKVLELERGALNWSLSTVADNCEHKTGTDHIFEGIVPRNCNSVTVVLSGQTPWDEKHIIRRFEYTIGLTNRRECTEVLCMCMSKVLPLQALS